MADATAERRRVLVIDDEPVLSRVLVRALSGNHDVVTASSGREARALLGDDAGFDVVLCDLELGDQGGDQLYAALCREAPRIAARVVFMTGGASTAQMAEFLRTTDRRVLTKPFELAELEAAVRSAGPD